jgi:hypothetical protein
MNPSARPQTSRNRDRALAKLRSITTGTAVAASIATAGFGGLAALTYTGTTDSTLGSSDTTSPAGVSDGTTTNDTTTTNNTTVGTTTGLQPTQAPVTTTRKKKHVTSGGSGG